MFSFKNIFLNIYKSLIALLLIFVVIVFANLKTAKADEIDITTSSVYDDLASMDINVSEFLSDSENKFITLTQYYDLDNNLRTYAYLNFVDSSYLDNLSLKISTQTENETGSIIELYTNYHLSYVNNHSSLYKFEVLDLKNLNVTTRRYKIDSLQVLLKDESTQISKNETLLSIDQLFIFNGISNNTIKLFHQEVETIVITDFDVYAYTFGDEFRYFNFETGLMNANVNFNDTWYIFFNTDKKIDTLESATITYQQYNYCLSNQAPSIETEYTEDFVLSEIEKQKNLGASDSRNFINYFTQTSKTIDAGTNKVFFEKYSIFGKIQKYEELNNILDLKNYQATDESKFIFTDFADKYSWGVHFLDTPTMFHKDSAYDYYITGSGVKNTAILELTFVTNGLRKTAYAISEPTDDFTSIGVDGDDNDMTIEELIELIIQLISLVVLLVLIVLCLPVLTTVFSALVKFIKLIFEIIIWIICLPFNIIISLFGGKKI